MSRVVDEERLDDAIQARIAALEAERNALRAALDNLLGKLEVMSGCNEYDMDGPDAIPEFEAARKAIEKVSHA